MSKKETNLNREKVNLETSRIAWQELQRFFAQGVVISVHLTLDLIEVADQFSQDNKNQVQQWLQENKIHPVTDEQALTWHKNNTELWATVVKPWVLIQDPNEH